MSLLAVIPRRAGAVALALCLALASGAARAQEPALPAAPADAANPVPAAVLPLVLLQTSLGDITIEVDTVRAPGTAQNFLRYVDAKRFDGATFYRAVRIGDDGKYGLVQGGIRGDRKRALPPVAHESPATTGLSHKDGAISMAREAPGSATGDFFFVVGDLVSLDGTPGKEGDEGYAVFGRVVDGMNVVRSILEQPRSETAEDEVMKGQMLSAPVSIATARRAAATSP